MRRKPYPTDISDEEWTYLKAYLPTAEPYGRPRLHSPREILDAIFYILKSGCAWRLVPHDFPPWRTVYHYFGTWRSDRTWERMHQAVRERLRGSASDAIPNLARVSSIAGRSKPQMWVVKSAATTGPRRRSKAAKASPFGGYARLGTQREGS